MNEMINFMIANFNAKYVVLAIVDILIVSMVIYFVLRAIQHTRTLQLAEGIAVYFIALIILAKVTNSIRLVTVGYVMNGLLQFSVTFLPILFVVVFQPELRKWFTGLGKGIVIGEKMELISMEDFQSIVDEIIKSVKFLSLNKMGALIVIERGTPLLEYIETGVPIKSFVKAELLNTIFYPNTSLHDGAVIIKDLRIEAARCILPLSLDESLDKEEVGTRHRAAVGITAETDALSIVVSEQTGIISLAIKGKLTRYLSPLELRGMLLVMAKPTWSEKEEIRK
ncbi:MAG: diadenylate cyclase CdaA [Caldisericaceae bacterium]|nr:diadenylate cyclase CdaA [Caldisericaceae bacterium]